MLTSPPLLERGVTDSAVDPASTVAVWIQVAQLEMDIKTHLDAALDSGLGAAAAAARG